MTEIIQEIFNEIQPNGANINGVGTLDHTIDLTDPIRLDSRNPNFITVCAALVSDRIPNIFNAAPYYPFNNQLLVVELYNGAVLQHSELINLTRGLYSTPEIISTAINNQLINMAIGSPWLNDADPGLTITGNTVTDQIIVTLNASKLKPAYTRIAVDLRKSTSQTDIAGTLGFTQAAAYLVGVAGSTVKFVSNLIPKLDTQGVAIVIETNLEIERYLNDSKSNVLCVVPFAGKFSLSDNVWPSGGQISPPIRYKGFSEISKISISLKTSDGKPMLFLNGKVSIILQFI